MTTLLVLVLFALAIVGAETLRFLAEKRWGE